MNDKSQAEIGIFGGTGLYEMEGLGDVRDLEVETPFGKPSSKVRVGTLAGRHVAFLSRHDLGHRLLPSEIPYRANIYAMKTLGVTKIVSVGAVGSLREDLPPRTLVVPDQFVDRTRHRPDTFFGEGIVVHVSLADPFAAGVRAALVEGARVTGHVVHDGGTYLCMEGPQFSTRAESLWYRAMGCHVIGMTAITEARLSREAEIAYGCLSLVTDYDAWRPHAAGVDASEILRVLHDNVEVGREVVRAAVGRMPKGALPENRSLENAIVTPMARIPAETRQRLLPILRPYL